MERPNTFKFYLNIAKTHVDVMTQSLFGFCWVFVFFTIFVINVLQKSKWCTDILFDKKKINVFFINIAVL